jgi:hypothetical protein
LGKPRCKEISNIAELALARSGWSSEFATVRLPLAPLLPRLELSKTEVELIHHVLGDSPIDASCEGRVGRAEAVADVRVALIDLNAGNVAPIQIVSGVKVDARSDLIVNPKGRIDVLCRVGVRPDALILRVDG